MSKSLAAVLLAGIVSLSAIPAHAAVQDFLYIDDAFGNIGVIDLGTKSVSVIGNAGTVLTDLAFTANGNLYGTSFSGLYSLSKTTGAGTLIGSYGAAGGGGMNALVGSGNGLLAASNSTSSLYSIGVSPFTISTLAGSTGGQSSGDLAIAMSGGALYETLTNGNLSRITLSGGSITSSIVGNTGRGDIYGLATARDGVTYAVAGTDIYTIDLATAALTPFFNYGGSGLGTAYGTAFVSEGLSTVPLPASAPMFGAALLALAGFGYGMNRWVAPKSKKEAAAA